MGEVRKFLNAVQFLTRLPVPAAKVLDDDWLLRSAKYFPAVGALIGIASAAVLFVANIVWTGAVPALLAVAASIAITGALHEDGLADTADGLGGGQTIEARLSIMRDSRIGTYGTLALGLGVAMRVAVLAALPPLIGVCALIAAHAVARFSPIIVLNRLPHAGNPATAKVSYVGEPARFHEVAVGLVVVVAAFAPLVLWLAAAAGAGLLAGVCLAGWMCLKARKLVGGYTGDILGAIEQMIEIGFLIGVAVVVG